MQTSAFLVFGRPQRGQGSRLGAGISSPIEHLDLTLVREHVPIPTVMKSDVFAAHEIAAINATSYYLPITEGEAMTRAGNVEALLVGRRYCHSPNTLHSWFLEQTQSAGTSSNG